jgi:hypothetical protein
MSKLRLVSAALGCCLLAAGLARGQPAVYYATTSATLSLNTLDSVATNGTGGATLLTATGSAANQVSRCTALAVDGLNGKLFFLDGGSNALWSVNLDGSGLNLVKSGLPGVPTDLALDVIGQTVYFTTSSTLQSSNTVQSVGYTGNNAAVLFTGTGVDGNGVQRCTAIAVDRGNGKIFVGDAGTRTVWSLSLAGGGLTALARTTNAYPTGLALDVTNQLVYFTASSAAQGSNLIQRVSYSGAGLSTCFTASGGVQRCTGLDLDPARGMLYWSDAGSKTLWRVPVSGGSASTVVSGLPAAARKVRWFSGPTSLPTPGVTGFELAGASLIFSATNGLAGGTYYVLTSSNLTTPLNQWVPVFTNLLSTGGNFTLTASNAFVPGSPRQFYVLRVQ